MRRQPICEVLRISNDTAAQWCWRILAANGAVVAESPSTYTTKRRAQTGALAVLQAALALYAHLEPGVDPWRHRARWFRDAV